MENNNVLPKEWKFELAEHDNKRVILILFPYNNEHQALVRTLTGVRWSSSKKRGMYVIRPSTGSVLVWKPSPYITHP